ncbi:MAG TPA: hydrogenase maturation nickel metallochaperone HypA [Vicinamibacteria bacterium]|nr:hydrogenase maturation nickel metallochaperone HypA [Vicinamibacteria bacterium]
MHEYSLVRAMADQVEQCARARNATAISRVAVRIGALSGVEPELFATAFTLCREGILAGAELDIRRSEAAWACPKCAATIPPGAVLRCASCDVPAKLARGDEILLEQIEMEVPQSDMEVP